MGNCSLLYSVFIAVDNRYEPLGIIADYVPFLVKLGNIYLAIVNFMGNLTVVVAYLPSSSFLCR